jgi:CubicO group peptidase (beta-lactamase class C family)
MARRWVTILAAVAALASTARPAVAQSPLDAVPDLPEQYLGDVPVLDTRPAPVITAESVEAFFDIAFDVQRQQYPLVGATVSVVHDGRILFQRGYGWADLERRVPVDPDRSLFRIGSVSKTFIWTALMQLVEQGLVDLDAPVERYIDFDIPDTFEEPVRVWHLMTHTAGFEESYLGFGALDADHVMPLGEALEALMPARVWKPGRFAAYSNYGSALAGYVVERVSGVSWSEYVETTILEPLDLRSTSVRTRLSDDHQARHARGYVFHAGEFIPTPYAYINLEPAGSISSTAADMGRFMLAHLGGGAVDGVRILGENTTRRMHSPLFDPYPELPPLLHGFYRSDRNGRTIFGHGGDVNQFHSNMALLPDEDVGVFVSYNSDPGAMARANVVSAFIDHFFPVEYLPAIPDPADVEAEDYLGEYVSLRNNFTSFQALRTLFAGGALGLVAEGASLRMDGGGPLVPIAPDRFTGPYGGGTLVFERDETGQVTHLFAGTPLGSLKRVTGLAAPSVQRRLYDAMVWIAILTLLGWTLVALRRGEERRRLPSHHLFVVWLQAGLFLLLVNLLEATYVSAVYGVGTALRLVLLALNANLGLGVLVGAFSLEQWWKGMGTSFGRVGYGLAAAGVVLQLWFAWTFNLLGV